MKTLPKPEVHLPPSKWICRCGAQEITTGAHPKGWEWHGAALLCEDCLRAAAFSHGGESGSIPVPTPIRLAAGPDMATSILLRSGAYLDLADPDCSRIAPVDIAACLRQLRFAGQTRDPYTIAQHSLLVLQLVEQICRSHDMRAAESICWAALMHDAPEAFIHDITRPLKGQLPDYKRIEATLEHRLAAALDIRWTQATRQIVKMADVQALAIEKRDLCPHTDDARPWPILEEVVWPTGIRITRAWGLAEAEERFLDAFDRLRPIAATQRKVTA